MNTVTRALLIGLGFGLLTAACTKGLLTNFPHRDHLAGLDCGKPGKPDCLNCGSCHRGAHDAKTPGTAENWIQPKVDRCSSCHKDDSDEVYGRSIRPALAVVPAGKSILFEHDRHLKMKTVRGQCVGCHAGAVGDELGAPLFPPMSTCLACHEHREEFDRGECKSCHRVDDLRTLKPVSFLSHDSAWMKRHGLVARTNGPACETCHAQTSCDSCHDATRPSSPAIRNPDAIERELVHRFDFVARHAIEAQSQPGSCVSCHQVQDCDACHAVRGVSPTNKNAGSPHPVGWGSGLGSARNAHGPAARRDIASCAACHDQGPASVCVRCHRVGGTGGSPHGPGWRSSEPVTSPQCQACHGAMQ